MNLSGSLGNLEQTTSCLEKKIQPLRGQLKVTRKFIPQVDSRKCITGATSWFLQVCVCLLDSSQVMTSGHQIILGWATY